MHRDPEFRPTHPNFSGEFESELRSESQARNADLNGSCVLGSEAMTLRSGMLDEN